VNAFFDRQTGRKISHHVHKLCWLLQKEPQTLPNLNTASAIKSRLKKETALKNQVHCHASLFAVSLLMLMRLPTYVRG